MIERFQGFSKDFFQFFRDLAQHNERDWFNANKTTYREVVQGEMSAFIAAMAPKLAKVSPHYLADPRPNGGSMFRIYRDVRFARDKRPYKENAGIHFRHEGGKDAHAPGFYVHLEPARIFYGGGIWQPPGPELAKIRQAIAGDPKAWDRVIGNKAIRDTFGGVAGDGLTRPPKGFDAETPHIEDIKRKTFFVMREDKAAAAMQAGFVDEVAASFKAARPLMKFLSGAVDAAF